MKEIFIKVCRWALAITGLAAAASCDDGPIWGAVEYGTPHCDFQVKCRVTDAESGAAVKGVKLTPGYAFTYTDENGKEVDGFEPYADAVETGDGAFEMSGKIFISDGGYDELHVKLTDLDPAADGHYKDSIYVVPMVKIKDAEKGSHWNDGTYGADVTIEAEQVKGE